MSEEIARRGRGRPKGSTKAKKLADEAARVADAAIAIDSLNLDAGEDPAGGSKRQTVAQERERLVQEFRANTSAAIIAELKLRERVRTDMNAAVEAILHNTQTGLPVIQQEVHKAWWRAINRALGSGCNICIRTIPELGKTEQICHLWPLAIIGNDPLARITIVGTDGKTANKHTVAIRSMVDDIKKIGKQLRRYWPDLDPDPAGKWNDTQLFFKRPMSGSKDANIQSSGMFPAQMGSRLKFIVFDDPYGATAVTSAAYRDQVRQSFKTTWLTRLDTRGGRWVMLCNAWHEEDLYNTEVITRANTCAVFNVALNAEMDALAVHERYPVKKPGGEVEVKEERYELPLPFGWTKQDMLRKAEELGDREFERLYWLRSIADKDLTFPNFGHAIESPMRIERWIDTHQGSSAVAADESGYRRAITADFGSWDYYGGVDLSSVDRPGSGMTTIAVKRDLSEVVPVDIRFGKWDDDELADQIASAHYEYGHKMILVETNALQDRVMRTVSRKNLGVVIKGHFTGARKWDGQEGLPSLDMEFKRNIWRWVLPLGHSKDCACLWCRAGREFRTHTRNAVNYDVVMATWLAYEAYRQNTGRKTLVSRVYTEKDLADVKLDPAVEAAISGRQPAQPGKPFDPFELDENGNFRDWHTTAY